MQREKVRPTEEPYFVGRQQNGGVRRHPAFGMISVDRMTGGMVRLFGSSVAHQNMIMIRLHEAEEMSSPHHSWFSARKLIAEVMLSESQWAKFVSSPNVGDGVPCTIRQVIEGDTLASPPEIDDESPHEKRKSDIEASVKKMTEQFAAAVAQIDTMLAAAGAVSKTELRKIRNTLLHPVDYAAGTAAFIAEQLTDHGERVVADIKQEVDAYVTTMAMRFPGVADASPKMIEGTVKEDRE